MRNLSSDGITSSSVDDSYLALEAQDFQDSVSKRRRHAVYFHRPPVWRYSSFQDGSSSPDMSEDLNGSDRATEDNISTGSLNLSNNQKADTASYVILDDSDSDHETPLLQKDCNPYGKSTLPDCRASTETLPDPLYQKKPVFCTRLHSYKDIRLGLGEQWAIEEGSLVIGVGPEYTLPQSYERRTDEFVVSGGDVYVVCSLYADLWALCAKVSSNPSPEGNDATRFAFLPLCMVTLAPNYSAFIQRSINCARYSGPYGERYPGNGLPVMPPQRSHSLTASNQIFRGPDSQISLPLTVRGMFRSLALKHTNDDFVPLDSTLEPILSTLTSRRWRFLTRMGRIRYSAKYRQSDRHHMRQEYDYSPNKSFESAQETVDLKSNVWRGLRKLQRASSWDSQKFKWLSWKV